MVKACESQRRLGHRSVRRCLITTYSPDPFALDPLVEMTSRAEMTSRSGEPPVPGEWVGDAEVLLAIAEGSDAFGAR
jgi:hypothetical protein